VWCSCTAYRHRSALHKQIAHVKQFYNVQFQREVDDYFDADLPDNELCAHILSRTVPTPASPHTQKLPTLLWQSMWYTIFHKLDNHLLILVTQRDAMLVAHTRNQLQKAIKHNRQLHKLRDCFSESAPTHVVETSHCWTFICTSTHVQPYVLRLVSRFLTLPLVYTRCPVVQQAVPPALYRRWGRTRRVLVLHRLQRSSGTVGGINSR
jgi:hypothetical protein